MLYALCIREEGFRKGPDLPQRSRARVETSPGTMEQLTVNYAVCIPDKGCRDQPYCTMMAVKSLQGLNVELHEYCA
jgi:hypothetical protein